MIDFDTAFLVGVDVARSDASVRCRSAGTAVIDYPYSGLHSVRSKCTARVGAYVVPGCTSD